ncbi:MAG: hypothetical protein ACTSXP_08115 [Promethearchaeota archaeon]
MPTADMLDLVLIGHVAKDKIETKFNNKIEISAGGGVYYGGHAALILKKKIAIITRCKKEDFSLLKSLMDAGAKIYCEFSKQTSGIHNIYEDESMEYRRCIPLGFAGLISPAQVPDNIDSRYWVIAPIMHGEVDIQMLRHIKNKKNGKICLDIQGFVRVRDNSRIIFKDWDQKLEGLKHVEILKADHAEATKLTSIDDVSEALDVIASWGPKEIIITHQNGISLYQNKQQLTLEWHSAKLDGRTGRGDTAFITYIASRTTNDPIESLKTAAAFASLKMERKGPIARPLMEIMEFKKRLYG